MRLRDGVASMGLIIPLLSACAGCDPTIWYGLQLGAPVPKDARLLPAENPPGAFVTARVPWSLASISFGPNRKIIAIDLQEICVEYFESESGEPVAPKRRKSVAQCAADAKQADEEVRARLGEPSREQRYGDTLELNWKCLSGPVDSARLSSSPDFISLDVFGQDFQAVADVRTANSPPAPPAPPGPPIVLKPRCEPKGAI